MTSTTRVNDALLFVYGECGPYVTEEEFNEWYDKEHVPARLVLSDFSTAARYKAADGKSPSWLAIYDVTTPEVLQSDAYKTLSVNASANEKFIISRLAVLHRGVYRLCLTIENPSPGSALLPGKVVVVVGILPKTPEQEEEIDRWYSVEHLPLLSKVPGLIRARRYKLLNDVELAGKADPTSPTIAFPLLTLYDWESASFADEPAYKEAISTSWSSKLLTKVGEGLEVRSFSLYKSFAK
ncbi:hypothetical protein J132_08688 [Termitomyces sp. J132]|nr:hypothetical protein H2248_003957 [Termitomyces sp. 'cryptogamus']KNZ76777.1 hypothetical protein J132_08688 [Termitomyces sp. J132]